MQKMSEPVIGFYIHTSHSAAGEVVRAILWDENGIEMRMGSKLTWQEYGTELRLILVGVYVEGTIPVDAPVGIRVGRVSRREKALRIDIAVDTDLLVASSEQTARAYLVALISSALRAPMARRKWDFDFEKLATDFEQLQNSFAGSPDGIGT